MEVYSVEKKKRRKWARVSLGWHLGYGYVNQERRCTYEAWCVLKNGKIYCEAASKKVAESICFWMNNQC